MKWLTLGAAISAGSIAHYGFWEGPWPYITHVPWTQSLPEILAVIFITVGLYVG